MILTTLFLCKLYKTGLWGGKRRLIDFSVFQWKNKKLSPGKTWKTRGKHSYTRSYPQYPQKSTTSVVRKKACQVRKFVLGFVIKSQIIGEKVGISRKATFLDK